jgi:hypothetical protein
MPALLAIDVGLRTGLALYGADGRLRSYRSQHFANTASLKRAGYLVLRNVPDLTHLALEGGTNLAEAWTHVAEHRGLAVLHTVAEVWRPQLLLPRHRRSGHEAKLHADELARRVIDWSDAPRPTALRHDTAEAILVGLWAVHALGWLRAWPAELHAPVVGAPRPRRLDRRI